MSETQSFLVSPRNDARHGHLVEANSFEDAAIAFVERWAPPGDEHGDVSLVITDRDSGRQVCLRLDLESGEAAPCG